MKTLVHETLDKKGKYQAPVKKTESSDVCLFLEGTYPYVSGGVSSWVYTLLNELSDLTFDIYTILPDEKPREFKYKIPENVRNLYVLYLNRDSYQHETNFKDKNTHENLTKIESFHEIMAKYTHQSYYTKSKTQVLSTSFKEIMEDLRRFNPSIASQIYSAKIWEFIKKFYGKHAASLSFVDYYYTWRYIHGSIFAIMNAYVPECKVYHTISTGYAGLLAAKAALLINRPLLLTEHGIYTKERTIEISRSPWIYEESKEVFRAQEDVETLKQMWIRVFQIMSKICYFSCSEIITLFKGNQKYQLDDGAPPDKMQIIPNGIDFEKFSKVKRIPQARKIIGFVGRIVPIKDVKTFLRAAGLIVKSYPDSEIWLMGPTDENKQYFEECEELVSFMNLKNQVKFTGNVNLRDYYPKLDILVLTSISEAQPLVILEAHAFEIPVVSTDVGACRGLLEGDDEEDRALGKSGLLTGLANPSETAFAVLYLLNNPEEASLMGKNGKKRVEKYYNLPNLINKYRNLYWEYINI